jgi:peptidyl-Lys metalloendopeptidase
MNLLTPSTSTRRTAARLALLTTALCVLVGAAAPAALAQSDGVTATLVAARASFASTDRVVVRLTLENSGDAAVGLLRWLTPEDGVVAPIFVVERDGVPVAYTGRIAKRRTPTEADYVFLAAGASVTWEVDLTDAYDFSVTGTYTLLYDVASPALLFAGATDSAITSNPLQLFVAGHAHPAPVASAAKIAAATSTFVGCTSGEQSTIVAARAAAVTYSTDADAYLQAATVDAHYTTWFGAFNATRYATVATHFTNILSRLGANPMGFDCSRTDCDATTYAYVFPSDATYTVHLCDTFFGSPVTGTDSQGGTLVHETSHFTPIADTDDWAYGQDDAMALAISNPARAVDNADNHEYFAESSVPAPTPTPAATPTPTPTSSGNGFVPPDENTAKCELGVAKQLSKLAACASKCQVKLTDASVKNKPFDDDACEDGTGKPTSCRAAFDAASTKLLGSGTCPACLDAGTQDGVADQTMQFVELYNGSIYCAGTVPFGGDDTGFIPPDADTAKCESGVANALRKLAACVAKCDAKQADALAKGKSFDVNACRSGAGKPTSCRAAFDATSAKLLAGGACPACLDAAAQSGTADAVTSLVAAQKPSLYCAGITPLP